jgi:transcriptional regulator with XRE-family HTH domain
MRQAPENPSVTRPIQVEQWQAFGQAVQRLRLERGWTLRAMARALAISPSYQSMIESGRVPPPSDALILRMATLLTVSPPTLLATAGRLSPATAAVFWQHPAIPPILSTIPGMTLDDAQAFCRAVLASIPPN